MVSWKDGLAFDVDLDGHHFTIDSAEAHGGRGLGPRPKPLLLVSLSGCAAMDVASILGKMRVPFTRLVVEAGGQTADEHPKRFLKAELRYLIDGDDLPLNKIRRALDLTEDKYCGIWATLAPAVELGSVLVINGEEVPRREG